jgi:hypothetical protein
MAALRPAGRETARNTPLADQMRPIRAARLTVSLAASNCSILAATTSWVMGVYYETMSITACSTSPDSSAVPAMTISARSAGKRKTMVSAAAISPTHCDLPPIWLATVVRDALVPEGKPVSRPAPTLARPGDQASILCGHRPGRCDEGIGIRTGMRNDRAQCDYGVSNEDGQVAVAGVKR